VTARDKQVAILTGRGYTREDVARRVGLSVRQVQRILADPEVRELAQATQEQTDPSAVEVLRDLLTSDREDIRLRAAQILLKTPPPDEPKTTVPNGGIIVYPGALALLDGDDE
jgi:hypothetical protein